MHAKPFQAGGLTRTFQISKGRAIDRPRCFASLVERDSLKQQFLGAILHLQSCFTLLNTRGFLAHIYREGDRAVYELLVTPVCPPTPTLVHSHGIYANLKFWRARRQKSSITILHQSSARSIQFYSELRLFNAALTTDPPFLEAIA